MLLIGTRNTTPQALVVNGVANLGNIYRKYCKKNTCGIPTFAFDGTSITLQQEGMYKITITAIVSGTIAGDVTLQVLENGVVVPSALATESITIANTQFRTLTIDYYTLVNTTSVLDNISTLAKTITIENVGVGATISNIVVNVLKVS